MKDQKTDTQGSCFPCGAILFCHRHPKIELTLKRLEAAYEEAFYALYIDPCDAYAQNTTTWD